MLNWLANIAQNRVQKYGAQYLTFAIFGVINYPLAYLYEYYTNQNSSRLYFRLIATLMCILLLFKEKWPQRLQYLLPLFWFFTIGFSLPTLTTYILLKNNFSLGLLINFNIGAMITILLLDWVSFLVVEAVGLIVGFLLFFVAGNRITSWPSLDHELLFIYMFLCIVIIGSIFSRNKEVFNNFLHQSKDKINARLESMVRERTAQLEKALLAKTEFLNNISHEIRTPIQGFTGISQGLVDHWHDFDDNKKLELASQVASNAKRLSFLVGNLLDLSKFSAGKMLLELRTFDLNEVIEGIIDECKVLYINDKTIEFKFHKSFSAYIVADQERIAQVLRNLFINAIKFSNNNSTIEVKLSKSEINYDNGNKQKAIHFAICDQGIGIPEDELEAIFSPFTQSTRTKTKAGGTGLGLAIARGIIKSHHGRIWAENNPGSGSTFTFVLPISGEKQLDKITTQEYINLGTKLSNNKPATILIVDDEEACLTSMEMVLYGSGYKLIKAHSGIEALNYLCSSNNSCNIDIIMLDLMMPDMYGLTVLAELKQNQALAKIPVILQSGTSEEKEIEKAYKMGIASHIQKPYNKNSVLTELGKIIICH